MPDEQRLERIENKLDALASQVSSGNQATAVMAARAEASERRFVALETTIYAHGGLRDTVTELKTRGVDIRDWRLLVGAAMLAAASSALSGLIVAAVVG